jgi:hypothetical protein
MISSSCCPHRARAFALHEVQWRGTRPCTSDRTTSASGTLASTDAHSFRKTDLAGGPCAQYTLGLQCWHSLPFILAPSMKHFERKVKRKNKISPTKSTI